MKSSPLLIMSLCLYVTSCASDGKKPSGIVKIYISTSAKQCQFQGYSPEETAKKLIKNKIAVKSSQCAEKTGMSVMAMCGAGTTRINVHEIEANNLALALSLGFKRTQELINEDAGLGFEIRPCRSQKYLKKDSRL